MKKFTRRLLALLLTASMILAGAAPAFADELADGAQDVESGIVFDPENVDAAEEPDTNLELGDVPEAEEDLPQDDANANPDDFNLPETYAPSTDFPDKPENHESGQPEYGSAEYELWKQQLASPDPQNNALMQAFALAALPMTVGNDFLEYYVASSGSYTIGTTGGNTNLTSDQNKRMLYGHPGSGSSNSIISIDGALTSISGYYSEYNDETKTLITAQSIDGVEVKQILSLFPNPVSEIEDTVRIEYQISNNAGTAKSIGFRTMWDTCLGYYDGAPFRVAGIGAITTELELSGNEIPESWLVIDDLANPGMITQGYPRNIEGLPQPDRLQFVGWGRVSAISSAWAYVPTPGSTIGDSAVCIYWDPRTIGAGEELRCVAYYGIGSFVQSSAGNMNIGVDPGVYQLKRQPNGGYSPNTFTTTAFVENGYADVTNLQLTLELPNGLTLAPGNAQTIIIPGLGSGEARSDLAWSVQVNQRAFFSFDIPIHMTLKIEADGIEERSIDLPITIPAMDVDAPHMPVNLAAEPGRRSVALTWDNPEDYGLFDVVAYNIYRDEELIATLTWEDGETPIVAYADYGETGSLLTPELGRNTAYQYKIVAYNFQQQPSLPANITIATLDIDDESPTKPGTPIFVSHASSSVTIRWGASTDETELGGYKIFKNGTLEKTVDATVNETTITGLTAGTAYTFTVQAFDTSTFAPGGNHSEISDSFIAAPVLPSFSSSNPPQNEYIIEAQQNIPLSAVVVDDNNLTGMTAAVQYSEAGSYAWVTINEWASIPANRQLSYQWAYFNDLEAGDYQLRYLLTDRDDGIAEAIYSFAVKHDDVLPTVSISAPSNAAVLNGKNLIISGNSGDNIEVDNIQLSYSADGGATYHDIATLVNEKTTGRTAYAWQYTFDATGLPSGSTIIKATAVDGYGNTAFITVTFVLDNTPPDSPYDFYISSTDEYIGLFWSYPDQPRDSDFSSFRIYRSVSAEGPFELIRTQSSLNFFDTVSNGVRQDTSYYYYITAVDSRGNESEPTAKLSGRIEEDTAPPVIVSFLPRQDAELCKDASISVSLYDNYLLKQLDIAYRKSGDTPWIGLTSIETDKTSAVLSWSWDVSALEAGSYQLKLTAADTAGLTSEKIIDYTVKAYAVPVPPANIETDVTGHRTIGLTWSYAGDASVLSGFRILRKTSGSSGFVEVKFLSGGGTSYADSRLTVGAAYTYKIVAVDKWNATAESAEITETAPSNDTEAPVAVIAAENLLVAESSIVTFNGAGSSDNDEIVSYVWSFGDETAGTGVTVNHTYAQAGIYTVTLTVADAAGNTGSVTATIEVVDLSVVQDMREITFSVVDSTTTAPLAGAEIKIVSKSESSNAPADVTLTSDSSGSAKAVLRDGDYSVQTAYNAYLLRNNTVTVGADFNTNVTIGMSRSNVLVGSLTATEMTYDEILAAGIDVSDPDNQQVFRFAAVLEFTPLDQPYSIPINYYTNSKGVVLNSGSPGGGTSGGSGGGIGFSAGDVSGTIYPVSRNVYLIIYGEASWLKEMFHVQLLLTNTSAVEYIENCVSELQLPDGLSFASMLSGIQNRAVQTIDKIPEQSSATIDWYVRGDKAGEYNLTALVNATYMPNPEDFAVTFVTEKPIKVWAGSALHMYIEADKYAVKGLEYEVNFRLENVSDKDLYNVSLNIFGGQFLRDYDVSDLEYEGDGSDLSGIWNDGTGAVSKNVLRPGETIEGTFRIIFDDDIIESNVVYMLTNMFIHTMEGSTTEIPTTFAFIDRDHGSGDIDGIDGVTVADALIVADAVLSLGILTPDQIRAADMDGDGRITMKDVILIVRKVVA
ncbi:MAG: PKD domain-containing protein [Clostridiales Family XIII bacterium]|jgi:PKD repeat protein|nr:PKD domain-containing protein [Clostridiales Family XIII bacterium]